MSIPRFLADEDLCNPIISSTRRLAPLLEFARVVDLGMSGASDADVLEFANIHGWLVVSHDVNSMKAAAEKRIANGDGMPGLFLALQRRASRLVAENLHLIWGASQAEEWEGQIVFLPQ